MYQPLSKEEFIKEASEILAIDLSNLDQSCNRVYCVKNLVSDIKYNLTHIDTIDKEDESIIPSFLMMYGDQIIEFYKLYNEVKPTTTYIN